MTPVEAHDAIASAFKDGWDAGSTSAGVPVLWPDQRDDPPAGDAAFARLTIQHAASGGRTHPPGALHERVGVVIVQCFGRAVEHDTAPTTAQRHALQLASDALKAFETAVQTSVRFFNGRPTDVGPDGSRYQVNAVTDFAYYQSH